MRFPLLLSNAVFLLVLPAPATSAYEAGDQVIVIHSENGVRISETEVEEVALGEPLVVLEVRGEQLKVNREQPGWILAEDVIALGRAQEHFNARIRQAPEDTALYAARAFVHYALGNPAEAVQDLGAAIRSDPGNPSLFHNRGTMYAAMGDYELALRDFDRAEGLGSRDFRLYRSRGDAYRFLGEHRRAIRDYDESLRQNPTSAITYSNRGFQHARLGSFEQAIADYEEAISLNPEYPGPLNYLSWLLATCPVEGFRDGERAVELATRLCELSDWESASDLDTLAAAYAESGHFEEAVRFQRQAIELVEQGESTQQFEQRLALYRQGQPYHDPPLDESE